MDRKIGIRLIIIMVIILTTLQSEDYYRIKNKWSKEYISILTKKKSSFIFKNNLGVLILEKKINPKYNGAQWIIEKRRNGNIRLKNKLTLQYIHNSYTLDSIELSQRPFKAQDWILEPAKFSGYYRIKNSLTHKYMHIENRLGHIQLINNVPGNWWSALWTLEKVK